MRVIVCGGRSFADAALVDRVLSDLYAEHPDLVVVQGGARGADALARSWAIVRDVPVETFRANWEGQGRAAGPMRNQRMLDAGADLVIAFEGGRGTADMVRRAKRSPAAVWEINHGLEGAKRWVGVDRGS